MLSCLSDAGLRCDVDRVVAAKPQATGVFLLLSVLGVLVCILRVLDFTYGQWRLQASNEPELMPDFP